MGYLPETVAVIPSRPDPTTDSALFLGVPGINFMFRELAGQHRIWCLAPNEIDHAFRVIDRVLPIAVEGLPEERVSHV